MCKRRISLLLVFFLMFFTVSQVYSQSTYSLAINNMGYLDVASENYGDNMRILVEKGSNKYNYPLNMDKESIPLQFGNGNYSVKILENIQGKRYRVVSKKDVFLDACGNEIFLNSTQPVYWDKSKGISNLAKTITKDSHSEREKVEKVYDYILKNIEYDNHKIEYIKDTYVPDIMDTINSKKGICYDYSATFAGLLRSLGIPTKLIKGYKNDLKSYHAWNEVLIDNTWYIIDTTYDTPLQNSSKDVKMIKEASQYEKIKEY